VTQKEVLDFCLHVASGQGTVLQERTTVTGRLRVVDVLVHAQVFSAVLFNLVTLMQYFLHQVLVGLIRGIRRIHLHSGAQRFMRVIDIAQAHMRFKQPFVALGEGGVQAEGKLDVVQGAFEILDRNEGRSPIR